MKTTYSSKVIMSEVFLEDILYNYNQEKQNFFILQFKSKGINKIIFITKHYNKDLEHFSIKCIQKNLQVLILFEKTILENPEEIENFVKETDKILIVFSKHCLQARNRLLNDINFDPIRDDIAIQNDIDDNHNIKLENNKKNTIPNDQIISPHQITEEQENLNDEKIQQSEEPTFITKEEEFTEPAINSNITTINNHTSNTQNVDLQTDSKKIEQQESFEAISSQEKINQLKQEEPPTTKQKNASIFKKYNLTIRSKLMSITALLIIISLSAMIFAASYFFKRDIETQIQTNNANIVNIVSQKIEDLLQQIYFDSDLIIKTKDAKNQPIVKLDSFENPYIFAIGIAKPEKNSFSIEKWYTNDLLLQQNALITNDFEKIIPSYQDSIALSLTGIYNVTNVSPNFNIPMLLFTAPAKDYPGRLILVFINGKKIIDDFPSEENSKTFMVNRKGDVLTFPEIELVRIAANLSDMPIVKMMLESKLDNGLTNFVYKNQEYLGAYKKISIGGIGIVKITEANKAFEPVYTTQRRNIYILGIVLVIGIIVIYFFSKTISQPIKELAIATEKVEQEDYSVRVIPRTKDEIGLLAYSFNKMVQGLEERERMKDAFGRFVNKEIAEKALRGEIKLGGEKKECTIFFSDLRGFTAMSEKMKPEEVVEYLNRYFTIMVDCVEKTHGIVDKFIGDAIMATWGTVSGYGNHTENAINGALLMRKALIGFNQYNKEHNLPIAKMGCGINTGEVVSGQIGSEKRLEFTVIGDAVNLASRIESLNKPFATDILISQDAYDRVKDIFDVVKMPAIKVKGKSEPQTIYCVLGRKDDPNRPKTLDELRKLVGIDWKPQIKEGQETLGEDQDEEKKYEILQ